MTKTILCLIMTIGVLAAEVTRDSACLSIIQKYTECLENNDFESFKALVHPQSYFGHDEKTKKQQFDIDRLVKLKILKSKYVGSGETREYVEILETHINPSDSKEKSMYKIITMAMDDGVYKIIGITFSGETQKTK